MHRILDATKPESAYFTERDGHRGAILVVKLESASDVARLAEPWFLTFDATVEFRIAMTADRFGERGFGRAGKEVGLSNMSGADPRGILANFGVSAPWEMQHGSAPESLNPSVKD
jgi:hypothetical protein